MTHQSTLNTPGQIQYQNMLAAGEAVSVASNGRNQSQQSASNRSHSSRYFPPKSKHSEAQNIGKLIINEKGGKTINEQ